MLQLIKPSDSGYAFKIEIDEEKSNEYTLMESYYMFLTACGYDKRNVAEAMLSMGDLLCEDDVLKDALAETFANRMEVTGD